jgi:hypothetical protein
VSVGAFVLDPLILTVLWPIVALGVLDVAAMRWGRDSRRGARREGDW